MQRYEVILPFLSTVTSISVTLAMRRSRSDFAAAETFDYSVENKTVPVKLKEGARFG